MIEIDHLLWASPDLDEGTAAIAALTGVTPASGGSHPGFGTRNSLLSLGSTYLEIIAPDPSQELAGNRGGRIAALAGPGLLTFAVRTPDLACFAEAAARAGLSVSDPTPMSRTRPDGLRLAWAVQHARSEAYPDLVPFAIDWMGSPHPAGTTPAGCRLLELVVLHPDPEPLVALYAALGLAISVERASRPGLSASLATPRGAVQLAAP